MQQITAKNYVLYKLERTEREERKALQAFADTATVEVEQLKEEVRALERSVRSRTDALEAFLKSSDPATVNEVRSEHPSSEGERRP